ncbi:MAG: U32 family peptidase [Bacteroides sp.]|nr:U32 family peptidase [Bacteroides sp.]MCM1084796.1 U32 family peptidase [Bacteroides sp.]
MNKKPQIVELLAPATNAEVALAAIDAGADAVYMGGPAFGARVRAGNSLQDLERVVRYAHRYAARCFLTLNTLVYEDQMPQALQLARQAYEMGVDALLIQDMGLIKAGLPPIELHASTQCHVTTPEKARFLESVGFKRLVLGRELSIEEIRRIADAVQVQIETFVHGALCVSYSGQCYMSCHMNGRSGNRGECAQSCRLPYDLQNAQGQILQKGRYLLSMKDLNADRYLEDLVDAGVNCLKIEGRLKDAVYVRNITAWYRRRLDQVLAGNPGTQRPSQGKTFCTCVPDLQKSYHRTYTSFNLSGKRGDWAVFDTPKATGERIGKILAVEKHVPGRYSGLVLRVQPDSSSIAFSKGDGLCFYGENGQLCGKNLENAEPIGKECLLTMPGVDDLSELPRKGSVLYRNRDTAFENAWRQAKVSRKIAVSIKVDTDRLAATMDDGYGHSVQALIDAGKVQEAKRPDTADRMLAGAFAKLGDTAYEAQNVEVTGENRIFVPVAVLNECRRQLVLAMDKLREEAYAPAPSLVTPQGDVPYPDMENAELDYRANVANSWAERFYRRHGAKTIGKAFELLPDQEKARPGQLLMVCRHCIRHQLGQCLKEKPEAAYAGDLYLCYGRHKFALHFDCAHCRMEVRTC